MFGWFFGFVLFSIACCRLGVSSIVVLQDVLLDQPQPTTVIGRVMSFVEVAVTLYPCVQSAHTHTRARARILVVVSLIRL